MSTTEKQRPAGPPPSGEKKNKLDVVFATSPDGKVYELPREIARQYEFTESRAKELGDVPVLPQVENDDEVGGRHRLWLQDGTYRYHNDWRTGPYVWQRDYVSYHGPHWHPNPNSPLAHDLDDY